MVKDGLQQALTQLSPEIFQLIPYSLLKDVLGRLLDDPYTAQKALQQGIQDWEQLIVNARLQAVKTIINDATWQPSQEILQQHQGQGGDKLEIIRLSVLDAIADLENAENIEMAVATIQQINLRVGSSKNWQDMKAVKNALTTLRDLVKRVVSQGLLDLTLGEADEQLKLMLPALTEAYQEVMGYLSRLKLQRQVLTFNDLELYALKALTNISVQDYYQQRWQVFLVDEFQDTNPTQAELLQTLTSKAELTIVGDIKQSIYGFRRADIRVFQQFRDRILANNGKEVILSTSFRTHETLINQLNQLFAPLLAENRQDLYGFRPSTSLGESSGTDKYLDKYLQVLVIGDPLAPEKGEKDPEKPPKPSRANRQRVEAFSLAANIKQMLDRQTPIFDRHTRQTRPLEPKDIAILTRTWQPLEVYGEALAAIGIPVAPAGGGNLLATREAKDATALLRFLANPRDDIALVAVLRSPFFAVSDRLLFQVRESFSTATSSRKEEVKPCWWDELQPMQFLEQFQELSRPVQVLQKLLKSSQEELPSRLLQLADQLTGYTAVIANLPGADRRLADWRGFGQLVKSWNRVLTICLG
ncbi:MAG: UvrD-helicase domain-containing protein [Hydrococcus sp. SU_1_0]|nr:UvrD-helicase domain-containing protein [Hydrococcus sp. SU_1_0]